ncbi:helix-turn-helix transcriptional regulator [Microbacterium sp. SS28]|uniref:helix-turn-helix transcriptional regulator n=1 Tax=Microbacterium sp. SS28 TaxID=2919948 RepID=UPI001FAA02A2|nr:helix-turn-helix transcriptional regulator [Microbacterium sp. SS28]
MQGNREQKVPGPAVRRCRSAHRALELEAKRFIAQRLVDPRLDQLQVAAHLHISVRTLNRVFEASGESTQAWIRRCRLDAARLDLADPACADDSIAAIGARWGLVDPAYFTRLFREAFGLTPTAFRQGVANLQAVANLQGAGAPRRPAGTVSGSSLALEK